MSLTVVGRGQVSLAPDVAVVDFACEATGVDPASALTAASAGLDAVRRALLDGGLVGTDLRSTDYGLWSETDQQGQPSGFRANLALRAAIRDLATTGALVSAAVTAGGATSRMRGLSLQVADPQSALRQARELAFADAQRTAEQLARLAGRELGVVTEVVDGEVPAPGPGPIGRAFAMAKDSGPTLDAGQLDLAAAVTVTWELG